MTNVRDLLRQLVSIDSVNPTLVPGGAGEAEIGRFVAAWLEEHGVATEYYELAFSRANVVGRVAGSGGGRSLMLNAHMDTVGLAGSDGALTPRIDGDRMYGRGAYDMKGSLAAIMLVAAAATDLGLSGDLIVTAVADEEALSIGSERIAETVTADAAIVTEPTGLDVAIAHRGFVWLDLETRGRAAHGSRYDLGIDAIARMGPPLVAIDELDKRLREEGETHPLLGGASVHASLIEGGTELSTYPDRCVLKVERRTLPGESVRFVEEQLREVAPNATVTSTFSREPLETPADAPIVELLTRKAQEVLGRSPALIGVPFWTDAALFADCRHSDGRVRAGRRRRACRRRVGRPERRRTPRGDPPGDGARLLRVAMLPTPMERAPDVLCGFAGRSELWLKREDVHELGVFKWRSALPVVGSLVAQSHKAVVTSSTGNHGAAVAWACKQLGAKAIVFVPRAANARKLALLESLGADVRVVGHDLDEAKDAARAYAEVEGLRFFEDGAEPLQYEAYEAIGEEIVDQLPSPAAAVVTPIGNGALAGGVGAAMGRLSIETVRVGVVAEDMPVMAASYDAGRVVEAPAGTTVADGLAVRVAIPLAVERLSTTVDVMLRVSEQSIAEALVACHDAGVAVEPSAAAALAAARTKRDLADAGPIVLVMTGRNVDPEIVARARTTFASM